MKAEKDSMKAEKESMKAEKERKKQRKRERSRETQTLRRIMSMLSAAVMRSSSRSDTSDAI
jgi:hypothetical protein